MHLENPKEDGGVSDIWMLRPRDWIEAQWRQQQLPQVATLLEIPASAGSQLSTPNSQLLVVHDDLTDPVSGVPLSGPPVWTPPFDERRMVEERIFISVPECGINSWARVLGIGECPQISPRPGPEFQVVTATYRHPAKQVLDVQIAGNAAPIGTTPNHPFWSADRQEFVRADELRVGERLQRADGGLTTVLSVQERLGAQEVFNLEVQAEHVYHVAHSGVLVHNGDPTDCLRYVYRELSAADAARLNAGLGLLPKGTGGKIADQVSGMSTRYISASDTITGTARFRGGNGLIRIDVRKAIEGGAGFVDHNNVIQSVSRNGLPTDLINSKRAAEVMFKDFIPFDAIRIIH